MGNWSRQQETKQMAKEKEKTGREMLGKFFYDLAKLIFATMTLVGAVSLILEGTKMQHWVLLACGIFATYIFAYTGYRILK